MQSGNTGKLIQDKINALNKNVEKNAQKSQDEKIKHSEERKSPGFVMDAVKAIEAGNLKNKSNDGSEVKPDPTPTNKGGSMQR